MSKEWIFRGESAGGSYSRDAVRIPDHLLDQNVLITPREDVRQAMIRIIESTAVAISSSGMAHVWREDNSVCMTKIWFEIFILGGEEARFEHLVTPVSLRGDLVGQICVDGPRFVHLHDREMLSRMWQPYTNYLLLGLLHNPESAMRTMCGVALRKFDIAVHSRLDSIEEVNRRYARLERTTVGPNPDFGVPPWYREDV